jgi:hypothetical protein
MGQAHGFFCVELLEPPRPLKKLLFHILHFQVCHAMTENCRTQIHSTDTTDSM